jgi:hypothetical protein
MKIFAEKDKKKLRMHSSPTVSFSRKLPILRNVSELSK